MYDWSDGFRRHGESISHERGVNNYRDFLAKHGGYLAHREQCANAARARWTNKAKAQMRRQVCCFLT